MNAVKRIEGYPGYYITASGVVWTSREHNGWPCPRRLRQRICKGNGYAIVTIYRYPKVRHVAVHALLALAFLGPRPHKHEVRHLDGNKANNALWNLAYGTRRENIEDMLRHGTMPKGEQHWNAVTTPTDVLWIREYAREGYGSGVIGRAFGLSRQGVRGIVARRAWAHIPERVRQPKQIELL